MQSSGKKLKRDTDSFELGQSRKAAVREAGYRLLERQCNHSRADLHAKSRYKKGKSKNRIERGDFKHSGGHFMFIKKYFLFDKETTIRR